MKMRILLFCFINTILLSNLTGLAQIDSGKNSDTDSIGKKPDCACDSLWKKENTLEVVRLLEESTAGMAPVWREYNLGDASFILDAGQTSKGHHCLGLWKKGKAVSYARLRNTISMLTPIYSYYLNYKGIDSIPKDRYFTTAKNAPAFKQWMDEMNVESAVYLLVDFSKLPFTVPSIVKVQIAIHESFHTEVMLRYWFTKKGHWPKWDRQPDRQGVQSCYTFNDSARTFIQKELVILSNMVEALLDGKKDKTCSLGNEYVRAREERYNRIKSVKVKFEDGSGGDCRTAEAIMELEEGLADYGSWTLLYNTGKVSKEALLGRYRAMQNDHFYLSGNMLMHSITLVSKEPVNKI
ncbi:MAG: hypothetical protein ACXWC7_13595, partial [Chitinophagaceae bacterium]